MSPHATLALMAGVGIALALVALVAVVLLWRATRLARGSAHRHLSSRDRRQQDMGPPEGVPERRHRSSDDARARRRDLDDPQWRVEEPDIRRTDRPQDVRADDPATYPPLPTARHRATDDPATIEHSPPTADMRTLPPPGSIRNGTR